MNGRQGPSPRRRNAALVAAGAVVAAWAMGLAAKASPPSTPAPSAALAVGIPTVVDPVRGVGEPDVAVDSQNNAWITGPAGSSTQTSYFWHSRDGGQTYPLVGAPGGHLLCPSGGGDSFALIDRQTADIYLTDQQALASLATGKVPAGQVAKATSKCFTTPAMTADRPFEGLLHPTPAQMAAGAAPQYLADGKKPIVYLSWNCVGCGAGGSTSGPGGLAMAWTDDGVSWHGADAGVPADNLVANQFFEASSMPDFQWHGPTVVDQHTGNVFTAISCNDGCGTGGAANQFGMLVGKPGPGRADSKNIGQFASEAYQTAAATLPDGHTPIPEEGSLFPIATMDRAGTLYEAWIQGKGGADPTLPTPPSSWHLYYSYSKDQPDHRVWSPPIRVDAEAPGGVTSVMGWAVAGDPGKVGFIWLESAGRVHPSSQADPGRQWFPHMAVATQADTPTPQFAETQVGISPNHLGDICLQGTLCGVTSPPGNRNMADFISVDIRPDGALQGTWANDANQVATDPTTLVKGVPVTETAVQVVGPRLIGGGNVSSRLFSTKPSQTGQSDPTGDALYPAVGRTNVATLDLTGVSVTRSATGVRVRVNVASLPATVTSPSSSQPNVWWLVTWKLGSKIYFAKAESDSGGAPTFTAGQPQSYDRPGLTYYTVPTMLDYRGGTAVKGSKVGNAWVIDVPAATVGAPATGSVLQSVTAWSVLDNGQPPYITVGPGNAPSVVDATPAYNAQL